MRRRGERQDGLYDALVAHKRAWWQSVADRLGVSLEWVAGDQLEALERRDPMVVYVFELPPVERRRWSGVNMLRVSPDDTVTVEEPPAPLRAVG
jgi:hypothetical protein